MSIDLAGAKDGVSERFVPDRDQGRLIEAEHLARYRWAVTLAPGRRVLDAGCGTAYGCRLLAEAGAADVVGIDVAESVLTEVAPTMPANVQLRTGDLHKLELDDDSIDLIVCFEVIEHVADPDRVLDELVRVLSPEGLLLVSSPNRDVFPAGDPHHHHEYTPDELTEALGSRLANVRLARQQNYLMSAALSDETFVATDGAAADLRIDKLTGAPLGEELYTLALAGNGPLPELAQLGVLTGALEFREWRSVFDVQTAAIDDKDNYIQELEARSQEHDRLSQLLVDAEQRLAEVPALRLQIADLQYELAGVRAAEMAQADEIAELGERLLRNQQVLVDVMSSPSWKVTKPLRAAKRRLQS